MSYSMDTETEQLASGAPQREAQASGRMCSRGVSHSG